MMNTELVVPGRIEVPTTGDSSSAPRQIAAAEIPENGIWLAGRAGNASRFGLCAPRASVSHKRAAASKITAPGGIEQPEGSIYSFGDLDVWTARLFATPEGLSRFVTGVVSSLRVAAVKGAVKSVDGSTPRALQPERASSACAIIAGGAGVALSSLPTFARR